MLYNYGKWLLPVTEGLNDQGQSILINAAKLIELFRKRLLHRKFQLPKFENRGLRNRKHPLTVPLPAYCES